MPIFISYSHKDKEFVDRLAHQLVVHNVRVWLDRWELNIGDSLLSKIQAAISGASALLVVLSKASASSPWCEKEINGGLLRELEERRVLVLPVLVEDCKIPLFLRDKLYADFRTDFDSGLQTILEGVARVSNAAMGRIEEAQYYADWAMDWNEDYSAFRITIINQAQNQPFTVLTVVEVTADEAATENIQRTVNKWGEVAAQLYVADVVTKSVNTPEKLILILEDQFERTQAYNVVVGPSRFDIKVSTRRTGMDTGRNLLVDVGQQLHQLREHIEDVIAKPGSSAGGAN
jgi:hypothetical protein